MENLQQYSRRNNLEIRGILEKANENVYEVVKLVVNKLECSLYYNDIDAFHRVRSRRRNSSTIKDVKTIIVKFVSRMKNNEILNAARKNGAVTTTDLGFDGNSNHVFLNEHLTLKNKILRKRARDFCAYKFCWVRESKIFMRKTDSSRVLEISFEVLDKMKRNTAQQPVTAKCLTILSKFF